MEDHVARCRDQRRDGDSGTGGAYVSDRTGSANVFLYDLTTREHYQLTNLVGAALALTEYSPAISWARQADRLAFTYFEDSKYTVWSVTNPRGLRRLPYRQPQPVAATLAPPADSSAKTVSVVALLDSFDLALPDTTRFRINPYRIRLQPDYVAQPSVGYAPDAALGRSVFGGAVVVLSDMLGNHHVSVAAEVNGRVKESRLLLGYTNLSHRWQYTTALSQTPYYFLSSDSLSNTSQPGVALENQGITTYVARQVFAVTAYPFNRFTRLEVGAGYNNVDRSQTFVTRQIFNGAAAGPYSVDSVHRQPTLNYVDGQVALVSDNTLFGNTGPIMGRRFRVQVSPVTGSYSWIQYLFDYRRYDPILFNYLTIATRFYADLSIGPDEEEFPKYIARPDYVRGYDRNTSFYLSCPLVGANPTNCSAVQLLGSRVAVANVELRFPLLKKIELGFLPTPLPPIDGLFFYDEGLAWTHGQSVYGSRPPLLDISNARYPLRSYGAGLRVNLLNYAILRWDYAIPIDQAGHRGVWTWSLWPSF